MRVFWQHSETRAASHTWALSRKQQGIILLTKPEANYDKPNKIAHVLVQSITEAVNGASVVQPPRTALFVDH